jgi:hypothetical protein
VKTFIGTEVDGCFKPLKAARHSTVWIFSECRQRAAAISGFAALAATSIYYSIRDFFIEFTITKLIH